jgi:hypothetical protein
MNRFVSGHGFSRAVRSPKQTGALAPVTIIAPPGRSPDSRHFELVVPLSTTGTYLPLSSIALYQGTASAVPYAHQNKLGL